ncbi:MAG: patatin-like phospholipase family protein [Tissierellaceae bacterium]|nr:patatin-like phospholipase family protein [Tissierellaceae bacterium]
MYGLVLEGGGAKGSYHIGVYKALMEEGIDIGGVVGTSIGALNGAMIVQGDYDKCYELWSRISYSMVIDVDDREIEKLMELRPIRENFPFIKEKIKSFIGDKGFDITPLKALLEEYIDEEKIRSSHMEFGIVTINLSEFKPLYIFLEDIPEGELTHYLLASAYLPFFKSERIRGKRYLDGGFYDNLPYRMLLNKGYKDLILIRTHAKGITRRIRLPGKTSIVISPSEYLGRTVEYDSRRARSNIRMGYYDGLRALRGLKGDRYYIEPKGDEQFFLNILLNLSKSQITQIRDILRLHEGYYMRTLFEDIVPKIYSMLSLDKTKNYEDLLIYLLEKKAEKCNINKYEIYSFEELVELVKTQKILKERDEISTFDRIIEKVDIIPIFGKEEIILEIADIIFS